MGILSREQQQALIKTSPFLRDVKEMRPHFSHNVLRIAISYKIGLLKVSKTWPALKSCPVKFNRQPEGEANAWKCLVIQDKTKYMVP